MNQKKIVAVLLVLCLIAVVVFAQAKAPAYGKFSGTVEGKAPGFGADVTVTLTLKNGLITKAVVKGDKETKDIGEKVIAAAPKQIVARNSAEIDIVAGATVTSKAVTEAGRAALAKAK